jgi:NlpC/P60 family putative phage cell wall peptidase
MASRGDIVQAARGWIGTRWQHQASVKGAACDCVGLIAGVAKEVGLIASITLPPYDRQADGRSMIDLCTRYMTRINISDLDAGDVAVMRFDQNPTHLAFVAPYLYGGFSVIHASAPARAVVEHQLDDTWRSRIVAAFALPGVAGE